MGGGPSADSQRRQRQACLSQGVLRGVACGGGDTPTDRASSTALEQAHAATSPRPPEQTDRQTPRTRPLESDTVDATSTGMPSSGRIPQRMLDTDKATQKRKGGPTKELQKVKVWDVYCADPRLLTSTSCSLRRPQLGLELVFRLWPMRSSSAAAMSWSDVDMEFLVDTASPPNGPWLRSRQSAFE
jgi:hypothetical protein